MDISYKIEDYIRDKYLNSPDEVLLSLKFRKAGAGFAVDFLIKDSSGFLDKRSTWVSYQDFGGA